MSVALFISLTYTLINKLLRLPFPPELAKEQSSALKILVGPGTGPILIVYENLSMKTKTKSRKAQPVRSHGSYADIAYTQLKEQILNDEMPAGYQATEQVISETLNMSRTPLREALIRLEKEGLVELRPRHGMRVLPISVEDMKEIYEVLIALESTAAGLVAARGLDDKRLKSLEKAVEDMDKALNANKLEAWAQADKRFHSLLVEFCGNARIKSLVDTYMDQSHRCRLLTLKLRPKPTKSNRDHEAVVNAIRKRDAEGARRIHRNHRQKSGEMLVALLSEYGLRQI